MPQHNAVPELSQERAEGARKEFGIDFMEWPGPDQVQIAVASSFLVNRSGEVIWSTVPEDTRARSLTYDPLPDQRLQRVFNMILMMSFGKAAGLHGSHHQWQRAKTEGGAEAR